METAEKQNKVGPLLKIAAIAAMGLALFMVGIMAGRHGTDKDAAANADEKLHDWGIVAHWAWVTTAWIDPKRLDDKDLIAQILFAIREKYGPRSIVWLFDAERFTPRGIPMTDEQLVHQCGQYDVTQNENFCYLKVTNANTSPPEMQLIETGIRPGWAK